jgi:hypothetical protein
MIIRPISILTATEIFLLDNANGLGPTSLSIRSKNRSFVQSIVLYHSDDLSSHEGKLPS